MSPLTPSPTEQANNSPVRPETNALVDRVIAVGSSSFSGATGETRPIPQMPNMFGATGVGPIPVDMPTAPARQENPFATTATILTDDGQAQNVAPVYTGPYSDAAASSAPVQDPALQIAEAAASLEQQSAPLAAADTLADVANTITQNRDVQAEEPSVQTGAPQTEKSWEELLLGRNGAEEVTVGPAPENTAELSSAVSAVETATGEGEREEVAAALVEQQEAVPESSDPVALLDEHADGALEVAGGTDPLKLEAEAASAEEPTLSASNERANEPDLAAVAEAPETATINAAEVETMTSQIEENDLPSLPSVLMRFLSKPERRDTSPAEEFTDAMQSEHTQAKLKELMFHAPEVSPLHQGLKDIMVMGDHNSRFADAVALVVPASYIIAHVDSTMIDLLNANKQEGEARVNTAAWAINGKMTEEEYDNTRGMRERALGLNLETIYKLTGVDVSDLGPKKASFVSSLLDLHDALALGVSSRQIMETIAALPTRTA